MTNQLNQRLGDEGSALPEGRLADFSRALKERIINENLFFKVALEQPVFVIDERMYYCNGMGRAGQSVFKSGNTRSEVQEGPLLVVLEKLIDKKLKEDYGQFQEGFLREELKSCDFSEEFNRNYERGVNFVVQEMFPFLRNSNEEQLDGLFGVSEEGHFKDDGSSKYDAEIEKYIMNRAEELEQVRPRINAPKRNRLEEVLLGQDTSKSSRNDSLISRIVGGLNFAIVNRTIFTLASVQKKPDLKIGRQGYVLMPSIYLNDLQEDIADRKLRELSLQALRENLKDSQEFQKLKAKRTDLSLLCKKKEYHEKDFGFKKNGTSLVQVYVEIPEHVLQSPYNGNLYRFDGHKLGVNILHGTDGPRLEKWPYRMGHVSGPFYGDGGSLCMGDYDSSFLENGMEKGKAFAKLLIDARNIVLRGYNRQGVHPHHGLNDNNFSSRIISMSEVKEKGLPITNINYQPGGS